MTDPEARKLLALAMMDAALEAHSSGDPARVQAAQNELHALAALAQLPNLGARMAQRLDEGGAPWEAGEESDWLEVGLALEFAESDWRREAGPRSQRRWVHVRSGRVVYSDTNPGAPRGRGRRSQGTQPAAPAATTRAATPTPTAVRRQTAGSVQEALGRITGGSQSTPADLHTLLKGLPSLTVAQLRQARQQLQASFGGAKTKEPMVAALRSHVQEMLDRQAPAATPTPPTPGAPAKGKAPQPAKKSTPPTLPVYHQLSQTDGRGLRGDFRPPNPQLPEETRTYLKDRSLADAVEQYQMGEYHDINGALWRGETMRASVADVHARLQQAFARTPPLSKPVTVFRGPSLTPEQRVEFLSSLKKHHDSGEPFLHKGYLSTSTGKIVGEESAGHGYDRGLQFVIKARHGLDVTPVADEEHKDEREMLLPADSLFKVSRIEQRGNKTLVHLEQMAGRLDEGGAQESAAPTPPAAPALPSGPGRPGRPGAHQPGDVWQGASGRWFTMRPDGRVVPARAPGSEPRSGRRRSRAQPEEPTTRQAPESAAASTTGQPGAWTTQEWEDAARSAEQSRAIYSEARPSSDRLEEVAGTVLQALTETPERQMPSGRSTGMWRIPELRDRVRASRREFDAAMMELDRRDQLRLVAIGDRSSMTPEELRRSVPGENETFAYVEHGPNYPEAGIDLSPTPEDVGLPTDPEELERSLQAGRDQETPAPLAPVGAQVPPTLKGDILDEMKTLLREKYHLSGLIPVHELRTQIGKRLGDHAASPAVFNRAMQELRHSGNLRLVSISDPSQATPEQLAGAIPGMGETLFYAELRNPGDHYPTSPKKTTTQTPEHFATSIREELTHLFDTEEGTHKVSTGKELRDRIRQRYGDGAASHMVLDAALHDLRRSGVIRIMSVSDPSVLSAEELRDAVPGVGETLAYIEPGPNYQPLAGEDDDD